MFSGTLSGQGARVYVTAVRSERVAEFHGGNDRQPRVDVRLDDVRYVAAAGAFLHPRPECCLICRFSAAISIEAGDVFERAEIYVI